MPNIFFFFFNLWKYLWAPGLGRKRFFNHQSFSFPAPSSQCRKSAKSHSAFPPSVWSSVPCPFLPLARSLSHIPFNSPCPGYYQTADSGVTTMTGDKTTEQACLHTWGPALSNAKDKEAWPSSLGNSFFMRFSFMPDIIRFANGLKHYQFQTLLFNECDQ